MNEKSEQIDARLNILEDDDQPLLKDDLKEAIIAALPKGCARKEVVAEGRRRYKFVACTTSTAKHAFLSAAVTFLGGDGNHPLFKKRIQLPGWFKPAYYALEKLGYIVHFLGVYHYKGNIIFVDFAPATYLKRKMNHSSAFVYVNDLFRAMKDAVASRVDFHGNKLTTIRRNAFFDYLSGFGEVRSDDVLFERFKEFNQTFQFSNWIHGSSAIREMQQGNWSKWRETEWPGWYLEFKFSTFLSNHEVKEITYHANSGKTKGALDFDLYFPYHRFYGDLKASTITNKFSPGNDQANLLSAIDKFDRFWYVIYEHETVKDKDHNAEAPKVTVFRHSLLLAIDGSAKSPDSYASRMKNRVCFKRMLILEVNRANYGQLLSAFNQGKQPDGSARAPKFNIKKAVMENFQVFHYEA